MSLISYKHHHLDGVHLRIAPGFGDEWIPAMWEECVTGTAQHITRWKLPGEDGIAVFVKAYRRRPSHGLLRRMQPGRAQREGMGYVEFSSKGIEVIPLIAWGEERHWGLWEVGIVVTKALDARTVEEEFASGEDTDLLERGLARIHELLDALE